MGRLLIIAAAVTVLGAGALGVGTAAGGGAAAQAVARAGAGPIDVRYVTPLTGGLQVLRSFDPPATPYGPGHLGVDLAAAPGAAVRSAGPGVVTFAGLVAARGVVVVRHADGIRTEYEPVRPLVRAGVAVGAGQVVGVVAGSHRSCGAASCLHWGARRGTVYLDPLALLRPLAPVRLLPWTPPGSE